VFLGASSQINPSANESLYESPSLTSRQPVVRGKRQVPASESQLMTWIHTPYGRGPRDVLQVSNLEYRRMSWDMGQ